MDEYAFDDDAKRRYPSSSPQRSEISPTPEAAFLDEDDIDWNDDDVNYEEEEEEEQQQQHTRARARPRVV